MRIALLFLYFVGVTLAVGLWGAGTATVTGAPDFGETNPDDAATFLGFLVSAIGGLWGLLSFQVDGLGVALAVVFVHFPLMWLIVEIVYIVKDLVPFTTLATRAVPMVLVGLLASGCVQVDGGESLDGVTVWQVGLGLTLGLVLTGLGWFLHRASLLLVAAVFLIAVGLTEAPLPDLMRAGLAALVAVVAVAMLREGLEGNL